MKDHLSDRHWGKRRAKIPSPAGRACGWLRYAINTVFFCALALAAPVSAQDCLGVLQQQRLQFINQAELCEVDNGLLQSIDQGRATFGRKHCVRPLGYLGVLDETTECARVHLCALEANNCAIRLSSDGMDCDQALSACLAQYPVPN